MRQAVVGSLVLLAFVNGALRAQSTTSTELPVRSVVLFSSGVGFFEHGGTVRGSGSAELRFKTTQINDVLKSLTLQDLDGGRVTTITYPSQDPISKTLRSFQVDITGNPGMASFLNQLRGARVTVQTGTQQLTGTILGVESRRKGMEQGAPIDISTLNLLCGASIRSFELPAITAITLEETQLQDELTRALSALSQARDQDKKPVTISYTGEGARRLRVGYVVETPIWKTSYRLILDEKVAKIQGWAIVENQTESDWNGVSLSLVSGRPSSFKMDLYQPLYVERPTVVADLFAGLRPQRYEAGVAYLDGVPVDRIGNVLALQPGEPRDKITAKELAAEVTAFERASITTGANSSEFGAGQAGVLGISPGNNGIRSIASGRQLGELFSYAIKDVTLARQKSAMLPIVTDSIGIERLSVYNAAVMPRNPLYGVRLNNTTGKHLLQGPVTVVEMGSYAGDARIDNIPPGQERLMTYGIDLDLLVDNVVSDVPSKLMTGKVTKGMLTLDTRMVSSREYRVTNKGTRDKTVVIEHPARTGWKFLEGPKPFETTPQVARFKVTVTAGKSTSLLVKEEYIYKQDVDVIDLDLDALVAYSVNGEIPATVRSALATAAGMMRTLANTEARIKENELQVTAITQEQNRIRENMKTVDSKSEYYGRLLAKLNEQETQIERAQKEQATLTARKEAEEKALHEYLEGLNVA